MMIVKFDKSLALAAAIAAAALSAGLFPSESFAQAKEQFFPLLVYRTGAYAPNGTPWANGKQDYIKMINARDGGINGVKITFEECETTYAATDKGVECYERLKGKGATLFDPQATGITFALTDRAANDKIPLITLGYGLSASQDGNIFKWNFPLMGTYWTAADMLIQHIGKKEGGLDKLKGKKIALDALPRALGITLDTALASHLTSMIFGALIVFFLIVEPHGIARLWSTAKEKLRLWPFPH